MRLGIGVGAARYLSVYYVFKVRFLVVVPWSGNLVLIVAFVIGCKYLTAAWHVIYPTYYQNAW